MKGLKPKLPKELFEHDFTSLSKKEPHARTRLRFLVLSHLKDERSITKVSNKLRVSRTAIHKWLRRLTTEGINGLREKKGRGPHFKFPVEQHEIFKQAVLELQHNRNGGRIRGEDVSKLMKKKFKVNCSIDTAYRTLSRVNLVWITGRSKPVTVRISGNKWSTTIYCNTPMIRGSRFAVLKRIAKGY